MESPEAMLPAPGMAMTAGFGLEFAAEAAGEAGAMEEAPDAGRTTFGVEPMPLLLARTGCIDILDAPLFPPG